MLEVSLVSEDGRTFAAMNVRALLVAGIRLVRSILQTPPVIFFSVLGHLENT